MSTGLRAGTNNDGYLQVNGTDVLTALSSGNVGIGTDNPTTKLYAYDNQDGYVSYTFVNASNGTNAVNRIQIGNDASPGSAQLVVYGSQHPTLSNVFDINNANNNDMRLLTNNTERLRITSSGNIGIGTDNPRTKLEIAGNTTNVNGYSDGQVQIVGNNPIAFVSQSNLNPAINRWGFQVRAAGIDGNFSIYDFNNSRHSLLINSSGNIGIGTNNPHSILQINGQFSPSASGGGVIVAAGTGSGFTAQNRIPEINVTTSATTTTAGEFIGLNLHNNSQTNDSFSPFLTFSRKSSSGSYQAVTAGIGSRSISDGVDTNWVAGTLSLYTSGTSVYGLRERLKIDQEGRMTLPYQPAFSARQTSGTVNYSSGGEQVFGTVIFNTGNHYNSTTGRFTAPVSGRYLFYFQMLGDTSGNRNINYLSLNNSYNIPTVEASSDSQNYNNIRASAIFDLSVGDFVSVKNEVSSIHTNYYASPNNQNWFYGYLIG